MNDIKLELEQRHAKTRDLMREAGIEAILILQDLDLLYYANSMQVLAVYIPMQGEVLTFYKSAEKKIKQDCPLDLVSVKSIKQLPEVIKNITGTIPGTIGFEFDVVPLALFNRIVKSFNKEKSINPVDASVIIKKARMIKSGYELSLMRKAGNITKKVFNEIKNILKPGLSELEVASEIEYLYRQNSHLGPTRMRNFNHELFFGHVLSGETGLIPASFAMPLGGKGSHPAFSTGPSDKIIRENEPVAVDYVCNYYGYHSDTTRTFVIGELDSFLIEKYELLQKIYNEIKINLKPGTTCSNLYKKIMDYSAELGVKDNFMGYGDESVSFIGHGIGIEIDEYPVVAKGFDIQMEKNMTIAFEPKMFFPGHGAIGLEDTFIITDTGCEVLGGLDTGVMKANV